MAVLQSVLRKAKMKLKKRNRSTDHQPSTAAASTSRHGDNVIFITALNSTHFVSGQQLPQHLYGNCLTADCCLSLSMYVCMHLLPRYISESTIYTLMRWLHAGSHGQSTRGGAIRGARRYIRTTRSATEFNLLIFGPRILVDWITKQTKHSKITG